MATNDIMDLIIDASKNKQLMDEFQAAVDGADLKKRWSNIKPGYSISIDDCNKLMSGREEILAAMPKWGKQGIY